MRDEDFEPRLGRMRTGGSRRGRQYLHSVLAAAARSGGLQVGSGRRFGGGRIGRGGVAARALASGERYAGFRARRAIVKTRLVRLAGRGLASAGAHLRYIQRDCVSRDDGPGNLYSAAEDGADGRSFLERCAGDRHQFRLIVSAEDGAQYEDLRPLVRRFMARLEQDLGTKLEWVAADHRDTLHPHTHVVLRGKDDREQNLVIAPDYIKRGMRERLAQLVSIDLGPRTDFEIQRRLRLEVGAERLTSIDRRLVAGMDAERTVASAGRDMFDQAIRTGRLRKLSALGLAEAVGQGRWRLAEELESVLRALGERGDIVRTLQRELKAAGMKRGAADRVIDAPRSGASVTGRLLARGLADELCDRHYLVIDGLDGRIHYVGIGAGDATGPLPAEAIVRISPRAVSVRDSDRRIAALAAAHGGRYSAQLHLASEEKASPDFVESHVRRLEAIRRDVGGVVRAADGSWSIPPDYLELAARHEQRRSAARPVDVELLSPVPLEQLANHDGATWLDRQLAGGQRDPMRDDGFGREAISALALRRAWLIEQGLASVDGDQLRCPTNMIRLLERRELVRTAASIAAESGLRFLPTHENGRVAGVVRRRLDLASGRFAMIEDGRDFTLVPWRPVVEPAFGKRVEGIVRPGGAISWTLGRQRGVEI